MRARLTRAVVRVPNAVTVVCSSIPITTFLTFDVITPENVPVLARPLSDFDSIGPAGPGKATYWYGTQFLGECVDGRTALLPVDAEGVGRGWATIIYAYRPFSFSVSPSEITFSYTRGEPNPPSQIVTISRQPDAIIDWNTGLFDTNWLSIAPTRGSLYPGTSGNGSILVLTPNMSNKSAGFHSTTINLGLVQYGSYVTIKVNFYVADQPGSLTATPSPTNGGTINIPAAPIVNGNKITLDARPNPGYSFVRWSGAIANTANPVEFVVNGRMNITAEFAYTGAGCGITLSPTLLQAPASGNIGRIDVSTTSGCTWDVTQLPSWLTIRKSANYLNYRIDANPSALARQATILIGNAPVDIRQVGESCSSLRVQRPDAFDSTTSTRNVNVTADPACSYIAGRSENWLSAATSAITGNQTLPITAQANGTGAPRLSTYFIGGQRLAILQKPVAPVLPYTDVTAAHSLGEYITLLQRNNIADTCGTNLFCPERAITRSEAARQIVIAVLGTADFTPGPATFTDVPSTHPHFGWIQKLAELGITNGCTATTFCPDAAVTRGQMAAFLVRARGGITATEAFPFRTAPIFTDVATTNTFFSHVQKLFDWGITNGCTTTTFCVDETTTRSQMATFLSRAFLAR